MSEQPLGPDWWQASDLRWYPPEQWTGAPGTRPPAAATAPATQQPSQPTPDRPVDWAPPQTPPTADQRVDWAPPQTRPAPTGEPGSDRSAGGTAGPRLTGRWSATLLEGWSGRERISLLAPDGQANVDIGSEQVAPALDSAAYAAWLQEQWEHTADYEEHSAESVAIAGERPGFLRSWSWTPPSGTRLYQVQLCVAGDGRGMSATAATPATLRPRYDALLRTILFSVSLPLEAGWWQAADQRWYPPERWTGPPGTTPPLVAGVRGTVAPADRFTTSLSVEVPQRWFAKEQVTLISPDGWANVIAVSEPIDPELDSAGYADRHRRGAADTFVEVSFEAAAVFGDRAGFVRRGSCTHANGDRADQTQLYAAADGLGCFAAATAWAATAARHEADLRTVLASLQLEPRG